MGGTFADSPVLGRFTPPAEVTDDTAQRLATSALVVHCEKIAASGRLTEDDERLLRELLTKVCCSFGVPSIAERSP